MTQKKKLTLVVWSSDLDRVWTAFGIALVAASMGMETTMVFTFWGLNVVKKNDAPIGGKGLLRKMVNLINRGGSKRLGLSRLHKDC